ncbi:MAG TPA: hypothetical protein VGR08_06895 [Thermomicrobiales bacterium]|nr:hypothetical protein [Thermomicrobiales bacterium]
MPRRSVPPESDHAIPMLEAGIALSTELAPAYLDRAHRVLVAIARRLARGDDPFVDVDADTNPE